MKRIGRRIWGLKDVTVSAYSGVDFGRESEVKVVGRSDGWIDRGHHDFWNAGRKARGLLTHPSVLGLGMSASLLSNQGSVAMLK